MNRRYKKVYNTSKISATVSTHIENNFKEYFIVTIIFFIGVIAGTLFINRASENQKVEISTYITTFITDLKNNKSVDEIALLVKSIKNNIIIAALLWFMGSTVIGILAVYLIICFRGFCLGYTISSIIVSIGIRKGILFLLSAFFLQNIIFIPCMFLLAVSGINLHNSIMKDRRKDNIKGEIVKHTILTVAIVLALIISSLVEVYISKNIFLFFIKFI